MKHLFVPYELAVKLKEKGFNEPCLAFYTVELKKPHNITLHQGLWESNTSQKECKNNYLGILAPLWQQVIDWFRVNHTIDIIFIPPIEWQIQTYNTNMDIVHIPIEDGKTIKEEEKNYRIALKKAIEEAIKLIYS